MTKIVKSLAVIAFVAAIAVGATSSYFSDTETSTGNTFTAGAIDLTVDNEQHYNGNVCAMGTTGQRYVWQGTFAYPVPGTPCDGTWKATNLGEEHKFFNFTDVKPGDSGEDTISLHVDNNDAWACMTVTPVKNDDMSSMEPELEAEDLLDVPTDLWDGELAQALTGMIWADVCDRTTQYPNARPGDNIYQENCDRYIGSGFAPYNGAITLPLADNGYNVFTGVPGQPLTGLQNYYIGISWSLPYLTGNKVQTDSYVSDISFYTEQSRNNSGFNCLTSRP